MPYKDSAISVPFPGETTALLTPVSLRKDYTKKQKIPKRYENIVSKDRIATFMALAKDKAKATIEWLLPQIDSWDNTIDSTIEEIQDVFTKEDVLTSISMIIVRLVEDNEVFKEIDKAKLLNAISEMLDEFPPEQMKIPEEELFERIKGVLALEAVSGILNELTPEQMEAFEEAVKRRPLFK